MKFIALIGLIAVAAIWQHQCFYSDDSIKLSEHESDALVSFGTAKSNPANDISPNQTKLGDPKFISPTDSSLSAQSVPSRVGRIIGGLNISEKNSVFDKQFFDYYFGSDLDEATKSQLWATYLGTISNNPSRTIPLLTTMWKDPAMTDKMLGEALAAAASQHPMDHLQWLLLQPWRKGLGQFVSRISFHWGSSDALAASTAINTLKSGNIKDWAVAGLIQTISMEDPDSARIWMSEIQQQDARNYALELALSR